MALSNSCDDQSLIVFYHIPKTAGTSICRSVRETVDGRSRRICLPEMDEWLSGLHRSQSGVENLKFLCGHFGYGIDHMIARPCKTFTFLRNPLEQSLSMHFEATRRPDLYPHGPLETLLTSAFGEPYFNNTQVRHLASEKGVPIRGLLGRSHLDRAKEVLSTRLTSFGILEYFESSLCLINAELNLSLLPQRCNESVRPSVTSLPPGLLGLLWDANVLDVELYNYGLGVFMQRVRACPLQVDHISLCASQMSVETLSA